MSDTTTITTTINDAVFTDGTTLNGSFTAEYDATGTLVAVDSATITVASENGTDTTVFTDPGTLPYAQPTSDGTYEIRFGGVFGGTYDGLYIDYVGEEPTQLATGQSIAGTITSVQEGKSGLNLLSGGTADNVTCYVTGARILTSKGQVLVEDLKIGDVVITVSGAQRFIRWIGYRSYADRFLAANPNLQPIRFRAGSLGDGLPRRDLLVSPEHAMFLDGVLIPAKALVNGSTIAQEQWLDRVDYFHVELDSHDVLLAEGAPSESFLEEGNRGQFHNAVEHAAMYPGAPPPGARYAPWVDSGLDLEAIRARLAETAGEVALAAA